MSANFTHKIDYDFSECEFPEDQIWIHIPTWAMIAKVCAFLPVLIFGIVGNFMILYLITVSRALRTPINLMIANMAVADLLTLIINPPVLLIIDFYQNYQLGTCGCKAEGFLMVAFLITTVFNLSIISYDRLTAIVLQTETRLTKRSVKYVICFTWLAGFLIALPLAMYRYYRVRQWKNFKEKYCMEDPDILPSYWYVLITIMVWLPLVIMLTCYTTIFIKLDSYEKRNLNRDNPLAVSYKKCVAKTLFIVVAAFAIFTVPHTILVILRKNVTCGDTNFAILWFISKFLMIVNDAVNPYIYAFNNDNFRRAYNQKPLFKCFKHDNGNCENLTRNDNNVRA